MRLLTALRSGYRITRTLSKPRFIERNPREQRDHKKRDRENSGRMNPNAHSKYTTKKWINTLAVSDFNTLYSKHKKVTIPCPNQNQCTSLRGAILFIFQVHLKSFNNNLRLSSFASFWQVTHTQISLIHIYEIVKFVILYISGPLIKTAFYETKL